MGTSIPADAEDFAPELYAGCRAFPLIEEVRKAIAITRKAFEQHVKGRHIVIVARPVSLDREEPLPPKIDEQAIDCGVLYVLWHQCFAVAHRATVQPYIPISAVSEKSGLATLRDKSSRNGYKARLVWMPPGLLQNMREAESYFKPPAHTPELHRDVMSLLRERCGPILFLKPFPYPPFGRPVSSETIEQVSRSFFPFPANTPRRVMRYLLRRRGLSPERVDVFLGHWRERKEPWGRWSTFNYDDYLRELRQIVPEVLADLGFGPR